MASGSRAFGAPKKLKTLKGAAFFQAAPFRLLYFIEHPDGRNNILRLSKRTKTGVSSLSIGKTVCIAGKEVKLTNLGKIFWPEGLTKAHLVRYYTNIAPVLLPYLYDRPLVMKRYPDGIAGEAFYQKECPDYAPSWIKTHPVTHSGKIIRYVICNDLPTLVWLANQACIEIHVTDISQFCR